MKAIITTLALILASSTLFAQMGKKKEVDPAEVAAAKAVVEKDFRNVKAHEEYIKAAGAGNAELKTQYDAWIAQYPKIAEIPFAYGEGLADAELPEAKPYLLKAVKVNPKLGKAWLSLSFDAERWGDFKGGSEYMRKASEADPKSPDYAFYYASGLKETDSVKHHKQMLSIPKRFPGTERGAQALYWLAVRTENKKVKQEVFELAKKKYNPVKSSWTSGTMSNYYDFLVEENTPQALALADYVLSLDSLEDVKIWQQRKSVATGLINGRQLAKAGKYDEALAAFNAAPPLRYSSTKTILLKEKAKLNAAKGNNKAAYDSLLAAYALDPTDDIYREAKTYAGKLNKDDKAIQADVWQLRKATAKPATAFSLDNYLTSGKTSLPDLKGKVVLVTYWFPGCGPCRGEFPHFENVVRKFSKDQLAYVGINVVPEQDPYVQPFMQQSGYSFTPVRDEPEKRGNLTARGAPTNYLIDKEGNIIFANFRTDEKNERTLELMINELLDK